MKKYLTITEYSRKYKVSRQTIYTWIGNGLIPKTEVVLAPRKGVGVFVTVRNKDYKKKMIWLKLAKREIPRLGYEKQVKSSKNGGSSIKF